VQKKNIAGHCETFQTLSVYQQALFFMICSIYPTQFAHHHDKHPAFSGSSSRWQHTISIGQQYYSYFADFIPMESGIFCPVSFWLPE
jgi:hypothetical protein